MIVQNSYSYIQIGLALRLLINVSKNNTIEYVTESIQTLIDCLTSCGFEVALSSMNSVAYNDMMTSMDCKDDKIRLNDDQILQIHQEFTSLEKIVFAEALTKKIFILPCRRFNTEFLLNDPAKLFKSGIYEKLDDIAQNDISSACKCLLFGEATAAAFHILRATESVLKSYYYHHKKTKRLEKPMWASMVKELRMKKKSRPCETLLTALDLIRDAYRNPTQHPQMIYEIDNTQDLFGVCFDAIGKMASEL